MNNKALSEKALLLDLLEYIKQIEKINTKPCFSVPSSHFVAWQHEMCELPGIQYNLQSTDDEIWLKIARLEEIAAPAPGEELKPWIDIAKSPEKIPQIKSEINITILTDDGEEQESVEYLTTHPEIQAALEEYLADQWQPWAVAERPRRKTRVYYDKLFTLHQMMEGAETPLELIWGIGYAAWKRGFGKTVKYPLLMQACEVMFNADTYDIEVRPRDTDPGLETDCYAEMKLPGVKPLEEFWRQLLTTCESRINPFEPSTYAEILHKAVGYLDSSGRYMEGCGHMALPVPDETLKITDAWVVFARNRSGAIGIADIEALTKAVKQLNVLPSLIQDFVRHGDSTVKVQPERPFRGLSSSRGGSEAMDLYFPMPYNDEQVAIVQKLHANDGVVVQGPPGTGKTHTIANIICHYLAQGKRILVTSKGESALTVLREKIPEEIRHLCVALLENERNGMKQFEHSIRTIASRIASIHPERMEVNIAATEEKINQLHAQIAHLDDTVRSYAVRHMRDDYPFHGRAMAPGEIAKLIVQQAELYQWFDDEPLPVMDGILPFDDADINALRQARMAVRADLGYLGHQLPNPDDFPSWPHLLELHLDLIKANAIDADIAKGNTLALVDSRGDTLEKGKELLTFLDERMMLATRLSDADLLWLEPLKRQLVDMKPQDPILQALDAILVDIQGLEQRRRELLVHALDVPDGAEVNPDVTGAMSRLVAGKSAFSLPLGKRDARRIIAAMSVGGASPKTPAEWALVHTLLGWREDVRKILVRWKALASGITLPRPDAGLEDGFRQIVHWQAQIGDAIQLIFHYEVGLYPRIQDVFGNAVADRVRKDGESHMTLIHSSLRTHLDKEKLIYARKRVDELLRKLHGCTGDIVDSIRSFLKNSLSDMDFDTSALEAAWGKLLGELHRLTLLRPELDEIDRVTGVIATAGANKWAFRLRTETASADLDTMTPPNWHEAWEWRQAAMLLEQMDVHRKMPHLFEERAYLTTTLARTYQELAAEKTWLGVYRKSTTAVRQALQAYLGAIQAIGKGTGKKAAIFRRNARAAMERARWAVPCWILPQWRISETIPADIGWFDLVIIDEASQSEITALPALLRAQKALVVGDDKQVSPTTFVSVDQIHAFENHFLNHQPFGAQMIPGKSIYDLAGVVFAGNSVMLKEHFRCVPAIIEFSNREFYGDEIKPLRIPKANERLDPPLVDIFVKGGCRGKGKAENINDAEARAIVDEIKAILTDPAFNGRSIGVVTLLGHTQARHIHALIHQQIPLSAIVKRQIHVGQPPDFQGRERDIMMISMVIVPGDGAAHDVSGQQQRFNVAMSRARDRMYLFRSVRDSDVREQSLNGRVIAHFKQPFRRDEQKTRSLRERCESGFEREMFDELVKRGYRVEPQVRSGGYRIDFVVEGNEGRRLAVECDGDRFHGPDKWDDDMARQRVLERAGWTFWRCFASDFVRGREDVMNDLVQTLDQLGIKPLGAESVDTTVWVISKEVDPYGVDSNLMPVPADASFSDADQDSNQFVLVPDLVSINTPAKMPSGVVSEQEQTNILSPIPQSVLAEVKPAAPSIIRFKTASRYLHSNPLNAVTMIDPKSLMEDGYTETLDRMIDHVIEHEGPVPGGAILQRIARAHGWMCPFSRMRNRVWSLLWRDYCQYRTHEDIGCFYWPSGLEPGQSLPFRPPGNKESQRKPKHICLPELTSLACEVLTQQKQDKDTLQAMSRKLGFYTVHPCHRPRLQQALARALAR